MRHQTQSLPSWTEFIAPRRCDGCGRRLRSSGMDLVNQWNNLFTRPVVESLNRMWGGVLDSWIDGTMQSSTRRSTRSHRFHSCGCRDCDCDDCVQDGCPCSCCIGDADLLIYARLGERRVVPLVVENNRHRERPVRLELRGWTTRGGKSVNNAVTSSLQPTQEFTLKSCEEKAIVLVVEVSNQQTGTTGDAQPPAREELPDIDDCLVYYADLHVEGCDIRPIRIALALLPRDCAAYEIDCGCGCC